MIGSTEEKIYIVDILDLTLNILVGIQLIGEVKIDKGLEVIV